MPIVPDEARTFGMEGLFRQIGIYSSVGQLYTPVDAETLMSYREDKKGQMLEEGITEAGSLCSWIAAATSYANHGIAWCRSTSTTRCSASSASGDFLWAAGDMQARGFLARRRPRGAPRSPARGCSIRTATASCCSPLIPNCRAYDPTYAYELAVIIQDGMRRMYAEDESIFYYITVMNENYAAAGAAERRCRQGILKGGYLLQSGGRGKVRATLLGSGTILRECLAAAGDARATISAFRPTCFRSRASASCAVRRSSASAGTCCIRSEPPRVPYVQQLLQGPRGSAGRCDRLRAQRARTRSARGCAAATSTLGTDGFGRSDSRAPLRRHFEVDRNYIALAALKALADEGQVDRAQR